MGTHVGLEMVTQKHLHDWHIIYRVYRAQQPGDPFEEVTLSGRETSPLYKKGEQSLIFCETPNNECVLRTLPGPEKPQEAMNAYADVRCPDAYMDKIRQSISLWRSKEKKTTDEEHGASQMPMDSISDRLCFETKSFTICMLPFLGDEKADETEGPERQGRTNCKSWIALVIAPGEIILENGNFEDNVNHLLLDGNLARRSHANRKRRHRPRWENKNLKSLRDADRFQTCLTEVGMRRITEAWVDNLDRATKACHAFNKTVLVRIHRSPNSRLEYWRKHVNEDLLSIYKLQKRLESLDATLFNNITNEEQGIWINFRKARAGRRLEYLEQKGGKRPQAEQEQEQGFSPNEEDKLERKRLHFSLTACLD
ncbi:hypothetical protein J7T55_000215 [Diaporthe amygdali]|uniref:uncharacterized protein n=1 Tax=Phomopsis amygdali TaxID=1214568 RepID=UPI0022FF0F6E|nr:uncharacterized protein J7T55_000215 [Diaporthe amygdali]KAJ0108249.1 hypothetical protein J7T55_000215 [Diaporthe amygdali]